MRNKSRGGPGIAIGVLVAAGFALYWFAGSVMNWLRVTMHGR